LPLAGDGFNIGAAVELSVKPSVRRARGSWLFLTFSRWWSLTTVPPIAQGRWPKNSRVCYEEGKKIGKDGVAAFW